MLFDGCHTYVHRLLTHIWRHVTLIHQGVVCCLIERFEVPGDHHAKLLNLYRIQQRRPSRLVTRFSRLHADLRFKQASQRSLCDLARASEPLHSGQGLIIPGDERFVITTIVLKACPPEKQRKIFNRFLLPPPTPHPHLRQPPVKMSGRGKGKTAKKSVSKSTKAGLQVCHIHLSPRVKRMATHRNVSGLF